MSPRKIFFGYFGRRLRVRLAVGRLRLDTALDNYWGLQLRLLVGVQDNGFPLRICPLRTGDGVDTKWA